MTVPPSRSRRRLLAAGAATLLGAPLARAQARPGAATVMIADSMPAEYLSAVSRKLAEAGFVEGRNLRIEQVGVLQAPADLAEARARQAIANHPDCIFMQFGPETMLLKHLTRDIPIVFHNCNFDPVRGGLIQSVARPGGNVTGTFHDYSALLLKRWALYKEVMPSFKRGARLMLASDLDPPRWKDREAAAAYAKGFLSQEAEIAAEAERRFAIRIRDIVVPTGATEEQMIAALRRERPQAIRLAMDISPKGPLERFLISERILSDLVVRVGGFPQESFRIGIEMVGRVLRGERPATMPAVQGTRYSAKVNPRMAKEMGITLPQSVLLQAEVIDD